ncbi:MAG TPA: glycosyl hydrolase [Fimbriimonas sp.]|nr:glycosyl hydrolase [Fimbriimonas sp.]
MLPIHSNASSEARELLRFLYSVRGQYTLTGEHNQMWNMSKPSERIQEITGKYPLIWGGEWGFSDERHDTDNVKYRPRLLEEIRRQHEAGRIVVMTYHQACPLVGEPCGFSPGVQMPFRESDWDALFTVGTPVHETWSREVDRLGEAFASLSNVPIIFRPYHEMNGDWFWWGGNAPRFLQLWDAIQTRFSGLGNLLWAWNPDKPWPGVEAYFPGLAKVDLVGTDIYPAEGRETYPQEWYDRMAGLAGGKPLALSEMSELPTSEDLSRQPWSWFMGWDSLIFKANTPERLREAFNDPRVLSNLPGG